MASGPVSVVNGVFFSLKRNRRAWVKLLSFQFNCFHFKCSIPTCFFFYHLLSLLNILLFLQKVC